MGNVRYPYVFSSINVGNVELPNRIVFPAWQPNYANEDGTVSGKLKDFYTAIADGGCGLVFSGSAVVSSDTRAFERAMRLYAEEHVPGFRQLFFEVEKRGSVPALQLVHYGRQDSSTLTGGELLAPSAIPCPVMSKLDPNYRVREMTHEDIQRVRGDFISAAVRAVEAGAKIVEVHVAHGYLLNEFLSPYTNKRNDEYGGSVERRARLIVEIIEGIKARIGSRAAISVRVSGHEFVEGGLKPDDFKDIIPLFEDAGMDMLNVAAGVYASMERIIPPASLGIAPHIGIASQLKEYASVPVCAVGSILSLETAESFIASGKVDMVAMGRAQVADPELVNKSASGREHEIRRCTRCNECMFWTRNAPEMSCSVNPALKARERVNGRPLASSTLTDPLYEIG